MDTESSPTDHEYAVLEAPSVQGQAPVREIHFYEEIDGLQQDHQYALLEATEDHLNWSSAWICIVNRTIESAIWELSTGKA